MEGAHARLRAAGAPGEAGPGRLLASTEMGVGFGSGVFRPLGEGAILEILPSWIWISGAWLSGQGNGGKSALALDSQLDNKQASY